MAAMNWGFPNIRGTILGDPYNKDYDILGSILGPLYEETTNCAWCISDLKETSGEIRGPVTGGTVIRSIMCWGV